MACYAYGIANFGGTNQCGTMGMTHVPTQLTTGEVTLTLRAAALLAPVTGADGTAEEPRVIDVDVQAF